MCDVRCIKRVYKSNERLVCENKMRLKREMQGAFCILNANTKSQTRKSMKINVICTIVIPLYLTGTVTHLHMGRERNDSDISC